MYSLGVDIGGSHITAGVFNLEKKNLIRETISHEKIDPYASKEEILEIWTATLRASLKKQTNPIAGIGIAMPGPFDYYEGISLIQDVDKLQSLFGVNLKSELASRLHVHPSKVRFINDASAFSIAEALIGEAAAYDNVVAITLGTGLGAGFTRNAKPIVKDPNVPPSGYLYNQYYKNELADDLFSTRGIVKAYLDRTGEDLKDVKAICDRANREEVARLILVNFGKRLGNFLKPYLNDFDAQVLVLGGNISKAFEFFMEELKAELDFLDKIYVSKLGEESALIGSALLLEDQYYSDLEDTLKMM